MDILKSGFMRLSQSDLIKGTVMAFATPILMFVADALQVPGFTFSSLDFSMLVKIGLGAGITYIIKNLLTSSNGKILGAIG